MYGKHKCDNCHTDTSNGWSYTSKTRLCTTCYGQCLADHVNKNTYFSVDIDDWLHKKKIKESINVWQK